MVPAATKSCGVKPSRPLGLGPVVVVDTSGPVDTGKLAATAAQVLGAA
jgi:hypothetical protein